MTTNNFSEMNTASSKADLTNWYRLATTSWDLLVILRRERKETRAWTITRARRLRRRQAGKIHSDFERGFIRAEIVDWKVLLSADLYVAAKEKGKVRSEAQRLCNKGRRRGVIPFQRITF